MALTEKEIEVKKQVRKISEKYNSKVEDWNVDYKLQEQIMLFGKRVMAREVIEGGSSYYITKRAEKAGITPLEFAHYIKQKADEFEIFFTDNELERDETIYNLTN